MEREKRRDVDPDVRVLHEVRSEGVARLKAPIHLAPDSDVAGRPVVHFRPPLDCGAWGSELARARDMWCAQVHQPDHPFGMMLRNPRQILRSNRTAHEDCPFDPKIVEQAKEVLRLGGDVEPVSRIVRRTPASPHRSEHSERIGEALEESHPFLGLLEAEGRLPEVVMVILDPHYGDTRIPEREVLEPEPSNVSESSIDYWGLRILRSERRSRRGRHTDPDRQQ